MRQNSIVAIASLWLLASCESDLLSYSVEQGLKQGEIILGARKIEWVLKQPNLDPKIAHLLRLTQSTLKFAEDELKMKVGRSYRSYYDLKKSYLTQIVMAAYPDRLESRLFDFPLVGSVPYKGYFEEKDAIDFENTLKAEGLDTYRREADAFSSLGWFSDPLLNTMMESEAQLTQLLFHELTHLNFYFEGESDFNEAFASYFGLEAAKKMLARHPEYFQDREKVAHDLALSEGREKVLGKKIREALDRGKDFYQKRPLPPRTEFFDWLRQHFSSPAEISRLKDLPWNNALLLSLGTYYELIPNIEAYACDHKWDESQFLQEVLREGAKIIPKILIRDSAPEPHLSECPK